MKSLAQQHAATEADHLERSIQSVVRVSTAAEDVHAARSESEASTEHLEDVETSHYNNAAQYTYADHAAAVSRVRCAELRLSGAIRSLDLAQRAVIHTDTDVAEAVAGVVSGVLPGVPVLTTCAPLASKPDVAQRPVVVVRQVGPTVHRPSGQVSGEVEAVYFKTVLHASVNREQLAAAVEGSTDVDAGVEVHPRETHDTIRFTVDSAIVGVPLIPVVSAAHLSTIGQRTMGAAMASLRGHREGMGAGRAQTDYGHAPLVTLPGVTAATFGYSSSEEMDDDGIRTLTVVGYVCARDDAGRGFGARHDDIAGTFLDQFLPGLGRVTSIQLSDLDPDNPQDDAIGRAAVGVLDSTEDLRDVSRVGYTRDYVVRICATFESRA